MLCRSLLTSSITMRICCSSLAFYDFFFHKLKYKYYITKILFLNRVQAQLLFIKSNHVPRFYAKILLFLCMRVIKSHFSAAKIANTLFFLQNLTYLATNITIQTICFVVLELSKQFWNSLQKYVLAPTEDFYLLTDDIAKIKIIVIVFAEGR